MRIFLILLLFPLFSSSQNFSSTEIARYKKQAADVEIIVDNYGIPHIYGKTDADAVFGLMYVQCKQNFKRVERNYLEVMGRLSEIEGSRYLLQDLQMQLIYDTAAAKADYIKSPAWLKNLLHAFADGINYYLYLNPQEKPAVLKKFEPWFPLMYTDGSISATQMGGLKPEDTRKLYFDSSKNLLGFQSDVFSNRQEQLNGSNGFAIAPHLTKNGNAILYINPHVTFYYRTEVHMVSEEGLNAYGAVTWGNFFIYQGFNESCGWMHTSSYADVADLYMQTVFADKNGIAYIYAGHWRPVRNKELIIPYKQRDSVLNFHVTAYYTLHGPVMGIRDGRWLSLKERNRSMDALQQSWLRTKANSFAEFSAVMDMRSNNSNNTVYADNQKNIAYWHGNFIPVRDTNYNWALPVDGTSPVTQWKGVHKVEETVHIINPASGWIQNANSTPFTASGPSSPDKANYPAYMAPEGENARGLNAVRLLSSAKEIDLEKIISIGYDNYLAAFDLLLPSLFGAYERLPETDSLRIALEGPMAELMRWDKHASYNSIAATLAIEWGTIMLRYLPPAQTDSEATSMVDRYISLSKKLDGIQQLKIFQQTIDFLESEYGSWRVAWGDINRFQRNAASENSGFSDNEWSLPVGLASAAWGSLPSYNSRRFPGTKYRYGVSGNSFVAAVEFGKKLRAKTIITGGASFDPSSPHFTSQAEGFINGRFKEINFYKEDVLKNESGRFHPGEEKAFK